MLKINFELIKLFLLPHPPQRFCSLQSLNSYPIPNYSKSCQTVLKLRARQFISVMIENKLPCFIHTERFLIMQTEHQQILIMRRIKGGSAFKMQDDFFSKCSCLCKFCLRIKYRVVLLATNVLELWLPKEGWSLRMKCEKHSVVHEKPRLCQLLVPCPWMCHFSSLVFSFLICKPKEVG